MMLGLDVGGTHTDVVVIKGKGVASKAKILTKQDDLLESVLFGLLEATEGLDPRLIQRVVVSTTLATNAIIEGRLEPVGIIASSGPEPTPTDALIALGAETRGHRQRALEGIQRLGYTLGTTVQETVRVCEDCAGVVAVDSRADTDYRILAIRVPRKPCPVCVETGWRWFDQADVRKYNFVCIQDGNADLYQVREE